MIRAALTALADRIMNRRVRCGLCLERTAYPEAHIFVNHAGDQGGW